MAAASTEPSILASNRSDRSRRTRKLGLRASGERRGCTTTVWLLVETPIIDYRRHTLIEHPAWRVTFYPCDVGYLPLVLALIPAVASLALVLVFSI